MMPRFLVNLLVPPLVALSLAFGWIVVATQSSGVAVYLPIGVLLFYGLMAAPCALHAVAMEWCYRRGLRPRAWSAVGVSAGSGCVGGVLTWTIAYVRLGGVEFRVGYLLVGMVTGAVVGLIVWTVEAMRASDDAIRGSTNEFTGRGL